MKLNVDNFDKLLLTFTDFEWSGQNVETEVKFLKIKRMEFLIQTGTYYLCICYIVLCMSVYRHIRKNNKSVRSENLPSGQIFFKKGFIWLV